MQIGKDGFSLLDELDKPFAPVELRERSKVQTLRQLWTQHFERDDEGVRWLSGGKPPPQEGFIESPYDPEARYSAKGTVSWVGYKVHLTETCEDDLPHLITQVETSSAIIQDVDMTASIHQKLDQKELLPAQHLVDTGYMSADLIVEANKTYGLKLLGPVRPNSSWQTKVEGAFDFTKFLVDWENQYVTCPQGKRSVGWCERLDKGRPVIQVQFARKDCDSCSARSLCTRAKVSARHLVFPRQAQYEALLEARQQMTTPEWLEEYHRRAGIEGTISQAARTLPLRRCRYQGLAKTHLQEVATAAGLNLSRVVNWLEGKQPIKTQSSRFLRLKHAA